MISYQETIHYLYDQLPMFQRLGAAAFKKDLSNITALCAHLGNPQTQFPSIHIAGTNGKGSVGHMLSAVIQQHGLNTGIYTSPHYKDFRERLKVNGKKVSKRYVIDFVQRHKSVIEKLKPSFFEITVAMAFGYFKREKIDFGIIETGLGGRLDSTNIINPVLSIITNIGFDHEQFLGNTLPEIAEEKAGIIKPGIPVVIGELNDKTKPVFEKVAYERGAPVYWAQSDFILRLIEEDHSKCSYRIERGRIWNSSNLETDLVGWYQKENIQTVLQSLYVLQEHSVLDLDEKKVLRGLRSVRKLTGMKGRWEILGSKPLIVADSAHNTNGIRSIMTQINSITARKKHFILGFVKDKPILEMLKYFPKDGIYYFAQPDIPRALRAGVLADTAVEIGIQGKAFGSVKEAYHAALLEAEASDFIFIGGSSFVVAEIID